MYLKFEKLIVFNTLIHSPFFQFRDRNVKKLYNNTITKQVSACDHEALEDVQKMFFLSRAQPIHYMIAELAEELEMEFLKPE